MPGSRERFITEAELDRILQNYLKRIKAIGTSAGDMTKAVYDTDDDGKVDVAETAALAADSDKVDGEHASAFADASHGNAAHSSTFITAADVHSNANDPAAGEKSALAGTSGTPGSENKYVTNSDPRNTDARTPSAHNHGGGDITSQVSDSDKVDGKHASDFLAGVYDTYYKCLWVTK
jgi:hypothetical protein